MKRYKLVLPEVFYTKLLSQNMMERLFIKQILLAAIFLSASHSFAQQEPSYSMFMYMGTAINPAMVGSEGSLRATALYRQQWSGIEGGPQTHTLLVDAPLANDRVGLGLSLINDRIGIEQNMKFNLQYAYRLKFRNDGVLAMGLQAGLNNYKADYTSVATNPQNISDNSFSEITNQMIFNFGSGIYYYSPKFYAGLSVPYMINQTVNGSSNDEHSTKSTPHFYLSTGYTIEASLNFSIKPSVFVKVVEGAPVQLDLNSNFCYMDKYTVGFSYRTNDSFSALLQLQLAQQFTVGYAYDFVVSSLSRYTMGNNEFMLSYILKNKKK